MSTAVEGRCRGTYAYSCKPVVSLKADHGFLLQANRSPGEIALKRSKEAARRHLEYYVALHHADPRVYECLISGTLPQSTA